MSLTSAARSQLVERLLPAVREAGRAVLDIYSTDFEVRRKTDASPVTEADERAEAILLAALADIAPTIPVIAEEAVAEGRIPTIRDCFWLVDPLDGTQEFISRNDEFTVNVALIEAGEPTVGVVFAPALERLFAGSSGAGAFVEENGIRRNITPRSPPSGGLTVVISRSHNTPVALENFFQNTAIGELKNVGSSLKLCLIAAGEADLYPRFGRTMEWDIAAGHAILAAAGGRVADINGQPLVYGKPGFDNPSLVAYGREE